MNTDSLVSQPMAPQKDPRPFSEIPPLWLRLPHMDQPFFAAEQPRSSALNTVLGVAVYAIVGTVVVLVVSLLQGLVRPSQPRESAAFILGLSCMTLIVTPISFYLNAGLNYLSALVFGGKGKFNDQAYLASLFFVPIGIIASVLSFLGVIPVVGLLLESPFLIAIGLVTTIFQYRVLRVVHGLSSGRAVGAVLAPFGLLLCICLPIFVIAMLMVFGPVIGNTFSSINQSLLTPTP